MIRCSKTPFSLQYDETTQSQVKKQMELQIHYWSPVHDEVWVRYYSSQYFGHANAMISTNDDIPLKQLLTSGSDGPNVNKTMWRLLEQNVKAKCPEYNGFVDIRTYNIHIIHNSFGKGIEKYGKDCEQLAIDLHSLFKYSAARHEDFRELQLNLGLEQRIFLECTSLRWLSIGPSVWRILGKWKAIIWRICSLFGRGIWRELPQVLHLNKNRQLLGNQIYFCNFTLLLQWFLLRGIYGELPTKQRANRESTAHETVFTMKDIRLTVTEALSLSLCDDSSIIS